MPIQNQDSAVAVIVPTPPTTGQTVTVTAVQPITTVLIAPAGTLANLTVALATGMIDGQRVSIVVTQIITAFTSPGSGAYIALPTALTAGQKITYVYYMGTSTWYYIGA